MRKTIAMSLIRIKIRSSVRGSRTGGLPSEDPLLGFCIGESIASGPGGNRSVGKFARRSPPSLALKLKK